VTPCPLFIELCAGTAAMSLRLHRARARPPVSRMGAKTGYADVLLGLMGLAPGQGARDGTRYLWSEPDPGVRLLLEAYRDAGLARAAADIIRGWAGEDPRALWERRRAEGAPRGAEAGEVARVLQIIASNELINVAWSDAHDAWRNTGAGGTTFGGSIGYGGDRVPGKLEALPTLPAEVHPDARAVEPREVARWAFVQRVSGRGAAWGATCDLNGNGGCDPRTGQRFPFSLAKNTIPIDEHGTLPADIAPDARTIDPGPCLPAGTWVFIDPPYQGTTGYGHDLPRSEVVALARRWAEAGAGVMVTEAEAIPELVAEGWHAVGFDHGRVGQARTFSKQKTEVATMNRAPGRVDRLGVQTGMFGGGV
jgi:hypothetical protein